MRSYVRRSKSTPSSSSSSSSRPNLRGRLDNNSDRVPGAEYVARRAYGARRRPPDAVLQRMWQQRRERTSQHDSNIANNIVLDTSLEPSPQSSSQRVDEPQSQSNHSDRRVLLDVDAAWLAETQETGPRENQGLDVGEQQGNDADGTAGFGGDGNPDDENGDSPHSHRLLHEQAPSVSRNSWARCGCITAWKNDSRHACFIALVGVAVLTIIVGAIAGTTTWVLLSKQEGNENRSDMENDTETADCLVKTEYQLFCWKGLDPYVPDCAKETYMDLFESGFVTNMGIPESAIHATSCDSAHLAMISLAAALATRPDLDDQETYFLLAALYYATKGPDWKVALHWLSPHHDTCKWFGISCNNETHVSSIKLDTNNLHGTLPPEIGMLTKLETMSFANNNLMGTLPDGFLAELTKLGKQTKTGKGSIRLSDGETAAESSTEGMIAQTNKQVSVFWLSCSCLVLTLCRPRRPRGGC